MQQSLSYIGIRDGIGDGFKIVPAHFGISQDDRRHHLYCVGKTGTGKSTLLRNLVIQDIAAGRGVALLDPHGDLAEELLDYIPRERTNDVFYFDPADIAWPAGFNVVRHVPSHERYLIAEHILSVFVHIWGLSTESTPRLINLLYNAIATLLENPGTSLLGIYRMLVDDRYRERMVANVTDPHLVQYWEQEFPDSARERSELISSTLNKVGRLVASPVIRNIVGQSRTKLDFSYLMHKERIIICNLSKGRLGEEASNLLGSLLLIQFYIATMGRAQTGARTPFHLFVDEFQNFSTSVFADMLSESRKYGLTLTLAHQFMSQLSPATRDAIVGNVGSMISFRVGRADAEILASEFSEAFQDLHPHAFTDLQQYEVRARLLNSGTPGSPFIAKTLAPVGKFINRASSIVQESRRQFSQPRSRVEEQLLAWFGQKMASASRVERNSRYS